MVTPREAFRWYLKSSEFLLKSLALGTFLGIVIGVLDYYGDSDAGREIELSERNVSLGVWAGLPLLAVLRSFRRVRKRR